MAMEPASEASKQFEFDRICIENVTAKTGSKGTVYRSEINENSIFVYLRKVNASKIDPVWKIHISLWGDPTNIRDAWNVVKDVLINHGIDASKVLKKDCYYPEFQLGKEITIYDQPSKVDWAKLINELTVVLNNNRIRPGYAPINDMVIQGSNFLSFRCDLDEENRKTSSLQARSYKPPHLSCVFEQLSIEPNIARNQPPKPQRQNEANIKSFYSMLEKRLANIETSIFTTFPVNYLRRDICNIGEEEFYQRIITSHINTNLMSETDFTRLKECITFYERLNHEFNYFNFNIANTDRESYAKIFTEFERRFTEIEQTLGSISTNIQQALETLSDSGSVAEAEGKSSSPPPVLPGVTQGYTHIQQVLASHALYHRVVSGQDRMIIEIGKALNINSADIDDALDARTLNSEQIQNIFHIIKSNEKICDVLVTGLKDKSLTLDQIKNISPATLARLIDIISLDRSMKILTSQAILEKIEALRSGPEVTTISITVPAASPSSETKPNAKK